MTDRTDPITLAFVGYADPAAPCPEERHPDEFVPRASGSVPDTLRRAASPAPPAS
jgi:hypothetical protein